ncbi:major facilitator superfamily-domain-containing protein [Xylariales sp. PMI_506]|nr:major facilitator superfamily-domain-containing protein [Xylariales sp. PMI_506]
MTIFTKARAAFGHSDLTDEASNDVSMAGVEENKSAQATDGPIAENDEPGQERPSLDAQRGVQDVEAVTLSWPKGALYAVFFNIWLLYFVNAFQSSILSNLLPYATSDFDGHALLNVIYVVADAMSAAVYMPTAKVLDTWGRAEGFAIMAFFATLGLILLACSNGITTFCAAYVFYTIGFGGMTMCVDVITADASQLKNRGFAYAFTSSPYMITAFAGAAASEGFYDYISWRWGFGVFAIVFPIVSLPLYFILKYYLRKAQKEGVAIEKSNRNILESIWYWTIQFDLIGVLLFSVGLVVFLLPFDLSSFAANGWAEGYIIAMIVVGFFMLFVFAAWERYWAPVPLLDWKLLVNRTVIGACLLDATYQISYYCWANYFTSFLQVVNDLSLAEAGYVNNTFNVVGGALLLLVGYLIHRTGRFKWLLYIAVPLYIFSQGLMIYFRKPNQNVGYLVMCQVFISIGGSIFIIIEQLAILAAVDHQHIAAALALLNVVGTVGDALGSTISGAIWTYTFPVALGWWLPDDAQADLEDIYEDLDTQLSYPVGSPERIAIQDAYAYAQTRMLAAGVGVMGLALIWILLFKNINLKKFPQVRGTVF